MSIYYLGDTGASPPNFQLTTFIISIEVLHTRDRNHVTVGGDSILGVTFKFATAAMAVLSKLAGNLVKEGRNHVSKQHIAAAGVSYPCDRPSDFILHINKYARFDGNKLQGHCHLGGRPTLCSTEVISLVRP